MSSNINPQNIDGAYPVAGQDNDSQGFRDNFTNTKTNFEYAAAEITDLQNKAVLKSALTGTTLNNNMGGSILSDAQLQDMSETRVAFGVVASPYTVTLNYAAGPYQTFTLPSSSTGTVTVSFSNFPASGATGRMRVQITVPAGGTGWTVTLPSAVSVGIANIQGLSTLTGNPVITFNQTGVFEFEFETNDGGTTVTIIDQNRNLDPIYLPSSEEIASGSAVSLLTTTTYFATGGSGETATLAAGYTGQVKVLAMSGDGGGNMVVTVTNPGWGGSGTITFTGAGQTMVLLYVASKWFVIGNGPDSGNNYPVVA